MSPNSTSYKRKRQFQPPQQCTPKALKVEFYRAAHTVTQPTIVRRIGQDFDFDFVIVAQFNVNAIHPKIENESDS